MSLQSFFESIKSSIVNPPLSTIEQAKVDVEEILDNLEPSFVDLWIGGFAGLGKPGIKDIEEYLKNYSSEIENIIKDLDEETPNIEKLYEGDAKIAVIEYINSVKQVLQTYVTKLKVNLLEMEQDFDAYMDQANNL